MTANVNGAIFRCQLMDEAKDKGPVRFLALRKAHIHTKLHQSCPQDQGGSQPKQVPLKLAITLVCVITVDRKRIKFTTYQLHSDNDG